jgi:hypothetical protein
MRRGRLIAMQSGWVTLLDEAHLRAASDYGVDDHALH